MFFFPVFIVIPVIYISFNIFCVRKRFLTTSLKARDRGIPTPSYYFHEFMFKSNFSQKQVK